MGFTSREMGILPGMESFVILALENAGKHYTAFHSWRDGKPGVYFLHIFAQKAFAVWLAKALSGLPYVKSDMLRTTNDTNQTYSLGNKATPYHMQAEFTLKESIPEKSALEKWLTERYCLYLDQGRKIFRYEIHHPEWNLCHIDLRAVVTDFKLGKISLGSTPDLVHYSKGVKVLAWKRQLVYVPQ
jgi:uncharacterized protein